MLLLMMINCGDDGKHNDYDDGDDDDECDDADNNCEYNENDVLLQRNAHCKRRRLGDKSGCADVWVKGPPLPLHVLHISKFSPCFTYFKASIFFIFSSARIFYISLEPPATSTAEKIQVIYNPRGVNFTCEVAFDAAQHRCYEKLLHTTRRCS